ncbi:MAG: nucleotidyltransferase domain-containing protein [Bacteroidia bacterium]|nr:nucleotidyltransferase domain-containing protein [Bacteroidia bacterium]
MIEYQQINEICMRIVYNIDPDKIILFGSYAKGDYNDDSDLDIIVVQQTDLPRHKRALEIYKLFRGLLIPMDFKVYTPDEFDKDQNNKYSFLYSVLKDCKVLYERKD